MQLHLEFLQELTQLRDLALHGTRATLAPLQRLAQLQSLTLENTPPVDLSTLAGAPTLETLVLAHGDYRLQTLVALKGLRSLELRALETRTLSVLRALSSVERLTLHGLSQVTDLRPIAALPALRELRIRAMPQLNVHHFEPLQACAGLRVLEVDVGSRTKTREIHRLMQRGNTQ
jgi:Leucine-rich repeat (LRR) protein